MHIGNDKTVCPTLKVNEQEMKNSNREKFLGDVITDNAKIDDNLKMRQDKGFGIVNQIVSILKEVAFGTYYFEMGILFRTSLVLNGILFNTEAMFSISKKHLSMLEECDNYLMRSLFSAEMGTPIESFFIETSTIPLKFVLQGRRLMYYWTSLRKSETELVKRVFLSQQEFHSKRGSEWIVQGGQDLAEFDIFYTQYEITSMNNIKFPKLVNTQIKQKASEYLTALQIKHSKSRILHQEYQMQEY